MLKNVNKMLNTCKKHVKQCAKQMNYIFLHFIYMYFTFYDVKCRLFMSTISLEKCKNM